MPGRRGIGIGLGIFRPSGGMGGAPAGPPAPSDIMQFDDSANFEFDDAATMDFDS